MSCSLFDRGPLRVLSASIVLLAVTSLHAAPSRAPLADAAEKMDRAAIRALLKQRASVNTAQPDGMTALHWAAYQDDQEMAEVVGGRHLSDWNEDPFRRLTADIAQHENTHDQQPIVE